MIPTRPEPQHAPGTRVRVVQNVRVGGLSWKTETSGTIEGEGVRPVGGMEMGAKALYIQQPTLRLRRDDGEVIVIALDQRTEIIPVE